MTLVTLLPPNASPSEVRSYQRKRGLGQKNRRNGGDHRPGYKKRRREKLIGEVRALADQGISLRQISKRTKVAESTIRAWLKAGE